MVEKQQTNLIYKHRCKECGIEIYEAVQLLDRKYWVNDFCDVCVKRDKRKETALKEVVITIDALDFLKLMLKLKKKGILKGIKIDKEKNKKDTIGF